MTARITNPGTLAKLQRWNETVFDIADTFHDLYCQMPNGTPFEADLLDILARLIMANHAAEIWIEDLKRSEAGDGHINH